MILPECLQKEIRKCISPLQKGAITTAFELLVNNGWKSPEQIKGNITKCLIACSAYMSSEHVSTLRTVFEAVFNLNSTKNKLIGSRETCKEAPQRDVVGRVEASDSPAGVSSNSCPYPYNVIGCCKKHYPNTNNKTRCSQNEAYK